ncbi:MULTISPECIES: HPP family protein [unclassified Pseudoalteromonas]|uniref:HPP family protein n=1 Tax=unclassified Pseudoalteromonas TaxID=194690 RepID=UPI000CF748DC|nr:MULTISPECIES: HPP family protein [unclassified Pseudoalteromonas]MBS3797841.1 HPP family protein [Pseudoalteromonas sp. BDTF-M6]
MNNLVLSVIAGVGAFLAIGLLSFFDATMSNVALLMAPFGATAVLVFGVPESPLAQPKNVILGHLITAFVGVFFSQYLEVSPLTLSLATGIAVSAMLVTKTTHPPAGANPLLIMLSGQTWSFLFTPVLVGAILIVLVGKGMQMVLKQYQKTAN